MKKTIERSSSSLPTTSSSMSSEVDLEVGKVHHDVGEIYHDGPVSTLRGVAASNACYNPSNKPPPLDGHAIKKAKKSSIVSGSETLSSNSQLLINMESINESAASLPSIGEPQVSSIQVPYIFRYHSLISRLLHTTTTTTTTNSPSTTTSINATTTATTSTTTTSSSMHTRSKN